MTKPSLADAYRKQKELAARKARWLSGEKKDGPAKLERTGGVPPVEQKDFEKGQPSAPKKGG